MNNKIPDTEDMQVRLHLWDFERLLAKCGRCFSLEFVASDHLLKYSKLPLNVFFPLHRSTFSDTLARRKEE
jgi:hypothetical protein